MFSLKIHTCQIVRLVALGMLSVCLVFPHAALADTAKARTKKEAKFSSKLEVTSARISRLKKSLRKFNETGEKASETFLVPTKDGLVAFAIKPFDLRTDDYKMEVTGKNGRVQVADRNELGFFEGQPIGGDETDFGRFSLNIEPKSGKLRIEGLTQVHGKYYRLDSGMKTPKKAKKGTITETQVQEITDSEVEKMLKSCGLDGHEQGASTQALRSEGSAVSAGVPGRDFAVELTIATDVDYTSMTSFVGNVEAARAQILSILSQVDGIYRRDLGITLKVGYQHFWTSKPADYPYNNVTNSGVLLGRFANYWSSNFSNQGYGWAHLFSNSGFEGAVLGRAFIGTVCSTHSGYSVGRGISTATAQGPLVVAHEMGHGFGAPHTGCGGGLMCATGGKLVFGTGSKDIIWQKTASLGANSCLVARPDLPPPSEMVNPPTVQATSGTTLGKVKVTWKKSTYGGKPAVKFSLYRSETSGLCDGQPIASNLVKGSFFDNNVVDGVYYIYTMKGIAADGSVSDCSVATFGYTKPAAPKITQQPATTSAAVGQQAAFTVGASGVGLSYQWQRNGKNISGLAARFANYAFTVTAADKGARFRCVVSNNGGKATSVYATLN